MKKVTSMLAMLVLVFGFGVAQADAAVPLVSGALGDGPLLAGEWLNDSDPGAAVTPYTYYLTEGDPDEAGIPDVYDISKVTLLQELGVSAVPDGADGIYLLVETYGTPSLDKYVDPISGVAGVQPEIILQADFDGDGNTDLQFVHDRNGLGVERLGWLRPLGTSLPGGATADYVYFGTEGTHFKKGSVLEYFFPTGTGGTPPFAFPTSFVGTIRYDNGGTPDDDVVSGTTLIPEPGTMFMMGFGLLGLFGLGKFRK